VDPLDGTKECIKRNGQFSVCIALMEANQPVFGVVGAPVAESVYFGGPGFGAFRKDQDAEPMAIHTRKPASGEGHVVLASLSHGDAALEEYLAGVDVKERMNRGSALKFCAIAEGVADLYPRTGPTMEWDTAAGHALLLGAGGTFVRFDGAPFVYNKPELVNPGFIVQA
jgi:3'(2'), 5'-bisphosphate nucleotidase